MRRIDLFIWISGNELGVANTFGRSRWEGIIDSIRIIFVRGSASRLIISQRRGKPATDVGRRRRRLRVASVFPRRGMNEVEMVI